MHLRHAILLAVVLTPTVVAPGVQGEVLKEAPPEALSVPSEGCWRPRAIGSWTIRR